MKIYGWTRNQTWDPCITSQVIYHWAIQVNICGPFSLNYQNMNHLEKCMASLAVQEMCFVDEKINFPLTSLVKFSTYTYSFKHSLYAS